MHDCDKSHRVQLLEELVNSLLDEKDRLRRGSSYYSSYAPRPPPVRNVKVMHGETGGLLSHPERIREYATTMCADTMRLQWAKHESLPCAEPCVYFFRKGERVSPSDLERITSFCTGAAPLLLVPQPPLAWPPFTVRGNAFQATGISLSSWSTSRTATRRMRPPLKGMCKRSSPPRQALSRRHA